MTRLPPEPRAISGCVLAATPATRAVGERAHLLADGLDRFVEAAVAGGGAAMLAHEFDQARAQRDISAVRALLDVEVVP